MERVEEEIACLQGITSTLVGLLPAVSAAGAAADRARTPSNASAGSETDAKRDNSNAGSAKEQLSSSLPPLGPGRTKPAPAGRYREGKELLELMAQLFESAPGESRFTTLLRSLEPGPLALLFRIVTTAPPPTPPAGAGGKGKRLGPHPPTEDEDPSAVANAFVAMQTQAMLTLVRLLNAGAQSSTLQSFLTEQLVELNWVDIVVRYIAMTSSTRNRLYVAAVETLFVLVSKYGLTRQVIELAALEVIEDRLLMNAVDASQPPPKGIGSSSLAPFQTPTGEDPSLLCANYLAAVLRKCCAEEPSLFANERSIEQALKLLSLNVSKYVLVLQCDICYIVSQHSPEAVSRCLQGKESVEWIVSSAKQLLAEVGFHEEVGALCRLLQALFYIEANRKGPNVPSSMLLSRFCAEAAHLLLDTQSSTVPTVNAAVATKRMRCLLTLVQVCSEPNDIDLLTTGLLESTEALSLLAAAPLMLPPFDSTPAYAIYGALTLATLLAKHPVARAGLFHTTKQYPGLLGGLQPAIVQRLGEAMAQEVLRPLPIVDVFGSYLNSVSFVESICPSIWTDSTLLEDVAKGIFLQQEAMVRGGSGDNTGAAGEYFSPRRKPVEAGGDAAKDSNIGNEFEVPVPLREGVLTAAVLTYATYLTFNPSPKKEPPTGTATEQEQWRLQTNGRGGGCNGGDELDSREGVGPSNYSLPGGGGGEGDDRSQSWGNVITYETEGVPLEQEGWDAEEDDDEFTTFTGTRGSDSEYRYHAALAARSSTRASATPRKGTQKAKKRDPDWSTTPSTARRFGNTGTSGTPRRAEREREGPPRRGVAPTSSSIGSRHSEQFRYADEEEKEDTYHHHSLARTPRRGSSGRPSAHTTATARSPAGPSTAQSPSSSRTSNPRRHSTGAVVAVAGRARPSEDSRDRDTVRSREGGAWADNPYLQHAMRSVSEEDRSASQTSLRWKHHQTDRMVRGRRLGGGGSQQEQPGEVKSPSGKKPWR